MTNCHPASEPGSPHRRRLSCSATGLAPCRAGRLSRLSAGTSIVAAATFALPLIGAGQGSDRGRLVATLDSIAQSAVTSGWVVGLSVAVVRGPDTLLQKGYGLADVEFEVPTPLDAYYELGSVTKQFTAAAVLQLRDAGRLDLDADFTTYLPAFPTQGRRVSVRQLLNHTSGITGITEIPDFVDLSRRALPRDSAVALIARQPFLFEPGTAQIYNNSAYILLGLIIEKQSGRSYQEYIEQHIFTPLGMTRSGYCSNTKVVRGRAHGYAWVGEELQRAAYADHRWPYAAGSLCSTTGDMVTWLRALHGGRVLSPRSYQEMTTPARLVDGTVTRYGMGLSLASGARGARLISHSGTIEGFVSHAGWYPDDDLTIVVLMNNTGGMSAASLASELAATIVKPVPPPEGPFPGRAEGLAGTYAGPARGRPLTVTISAGSDGAVMVSPNGVPAQPARWIEGLTFQSGPNQIRFDLRNPAAPVLHVSGTTYHYVLRRQ